MRKLFLLVLLPLSVSAENWVAVGENIYVDRDSAKISGDIARITMTMGSDFSDRAEFYFDCKKKVVFIRGRSDPIKYEEGDFFSSAANIACRRPWEIWK